MGANQILILGLADAWPAPRIPSERLGKLELEFPANPLDALAGTQPRTLLLDTPPSPRRVVAFTDPNDQLSWILTPMEYARGAFEVTVVVVSNTNTIFT